MPPHCLLLLHTQRLSQALQDTIAYQMLYRTEPESNTAWTKAHKVMTWWHEANFRAVCDPEPHPPVTLNAGVPEIEQNQASSRMCSLCIHCRAVGITKQHSLKAVRQAHVRILRDCPRLWGQCLRYCIQRRVLVQGGLLQHCSALCSSLPVTCGIWHHSTARTMCGDPAQRREQLVALHQLICSADVQLATAMRLLTHELLAC
jgi:hypothetical protein